MSWFASRRDARRSPAVPRAKAPPHSPTTTRNVRRHSTQDEYPVVLSNIYMTSQAQLNGKSESLEARLHEIEQTNEVATAIITAIGSAAIPTLTEMLNHPEWLYRSAAAFFLGQLGPSAEPAVPALLQRLQDDDWRVRRLAGYALEYYFNPQPWMWRDCGSKCRVTPSDAIQPDQQGFAKALMACVNDGNAEVRVMAVGLLGRLGALARPALPLLTERLADDDERVRYYAQAALIKIDPEAAAKAGLK